jgi:hypothetical protein
MGSGMQSAQPGVSISQAPNHYAFSKEQQLSTTDTASSKFLFYPAAEAPVSTLSELPSCDLGQSVSRLLTTKQGKQRTVKPLKSDG